MTTYVLVHGAWSGAHGFRHVRPLLRAEGHDVFTPSLTGIGERVHLDRSPGRRSATHIADVVNQILYEDLDDIVLLGFSYGGVVVTGSLEHVAERVRHLVVPRRVRAPTTATRCSGWSARPPTPMTLGEPWSVMPAPRQFDDPAEAAFTDARRTPHPAGLLHRAGPAGPPTRVVPVRAHLHPGHRRRARRARRGRCSTAAAAHARASAAWRYREIATNHMVASNRPAELAAILLELG